MSKLLEYRQTSNKLANVQVRMDDETPNEINGYSAVFYRADNPGTEYVIWDDPKESVVERIQPGAFDRAIAEKHDARAFFNHDANQLLGRVSAGTCNLRVDDFGLWFGVPVDMYDPDHQRVAAKINRGDVTGSSFAFYAEKTSWEEYTKNSKRYYIRNVEDVVLIDVGPVVWPAYSGTQTSVRSCLPTKEAAIEQRSAVKADLADYLKYRWAQQVEIDSRWHELNS